MQNDELMMTFTPNTIEHLGVRMYSTLPPVIAELVANAYDADATELHIHLKDHTDKEIIVSDNGHGMSFDEINNKFLRIGRNRRNEEGNQKSPGGRNVIGKKGLGKLSFFGIAHEIEVQTTKDKKRNSFSMKLIDILAYDNKEKQENYKPKMLEDTDMPSDIENGTKFILRDISRTSDFNEDALADNLSKFFIIDPEFKIFVKRNDGDEILIENERRYANLTKQVEWKVPNDIGLETDYEKKDEVVGHLMATERPIPPSTKMKGITLFSRKKLVNLPEYFSDSTSSHFFTYLTGWLEIDFIDDLGEDVISTNRQSLNWEHQDMIKLREYLKKMLGWMEGDWRSKRAEKKQKELEKKTGMKIGEWRKNIPKNIDVNLDSIINALTKDAELTEEKAVSSLKGLQKIIKPYPYFHWHKLHPKLHNLVYPYYKSEDYYGAVMEGVIEYGNEVKAKTGSSFDERVLLENIFSIENPKLFVTKKFKRADGENFKKGTIKNIEEGHRSLVIAMWQAFRCPIAHETVEDLKKSGLFSDQDCLDALGLLSHLFRRLENSETPESK